MVSINFLINAAHSTHVEAEVFDRPEKLGAKQAASLVEFEDDPTDEDEDWYVELAEKGIEMEEEVEEKDEVEVGEEEQEVEEEDEDEEVEVREELPIKKVNPQRIRPVKVAKTLKPAKVTRAIKEKREVALLAGLEPRLPTTVEGQAESRPGTPQPPTWHRDYEMKGTYICF